MIEKFDFNEKIKIKNLAREFLADIFSKCYYPGYLTQAQKEDQEYYEEFQEEFLSTLTQVQKKDYDTLDSIRNAVNSTDYDYHILLGMRIKAAFDEIMNNPLEILELYDSRGKSAREMYKSVKQKENLNSSL